MISYIILGIWTFILGPLMFRKVINVNEEINPFKKNLLVLISGPLLWLLKIACFIVRTLRFLWWLINIVLNKFYLWFGK